MALHIMNNLSRKLLLVATGLFSQELLADCPRLEIDKELILITHVKIAQDDGITSQKIRALIPSQYEGSPLQWVKLLHKSPYISALFKPYDDFDRENYSRIDLELDKTFLDGASFTFYYGTKYNCFTHTKSNIKIKTNDDYRASLTVKDAKPVDGIYELGNVFSNTKIELKDGHFQYWFSSDVIVKDGPEYPLSGKYIFTGNAVTLEHELILGMQRTWTFKEINGLITLWREDALDYYDKEKGFHSYGILKKIKTNFRN